MSEERPQLRMRWTGEMPGAPNGVSAPEGYHLRICQPGDEPRFFELMEQCGWPGWDSERLAFSLERVLPDGWLMAIEESSGRVVGTAMALHNYTGKRPFSGDIGWVAVDPAHRGRGLGKLLVAGVTWRLAGAGYLDFGLGTEDFRLAAISIYFDLGYVPVPDSPDAAERWQTICERLGRPFEPEKWAEHTAGRDASRLRADDV
jgi:GNAT superfamily N-acetyltransferase